MSFAIRAFIARTNARRGKLRAADKRLRVCKRATRTLLLEQSRRELEATTQKLRGMAVDLVKAALGAYARGAPIDPEASPEENREVVMSYLLSAQRIPIHGQACPILVNCGFDATRLTHGDYHGTPCGFADGLSLLKFVGFVHDDAPSLKDAELLMSLDGGATKH